MTVFRPFSAIRPKGELAGQIAALPYDVMNSEEAYEMAKDNPYSFLHIDRAEIDLPKETDVYSEAVYEKASSNLRRMIDEGSFIQEKKPCYYIYREEMNGRSQAGVVGCASIDDYLQNIIKKNELTIAAKEADRIHHVDTCDANTGPIFLTFRKNEGIEELMKRIMEQEKPVYDFISEDHIRHTVWRIAGDSEIDFISSQFSQIPCLYIADGHHRTASAVKVGLKRREQKPDYTGDEEFNYFLAVAFPSSELSIWDYNRAVKDLNGLDTETFLEKVSESFSVERIEGPYGTTEEEIEHIRPCVRHMTAMNLRGTWYHLTAKKELYEGKDVVDTLDVALLQNYLLDPILGVKDPRKDARISFVGGIRGLSELSNMVRDGYAVAFAMYPTSMEELMAISDEGKIMPPKSTWFEPKLRSGLFIHSLSRALS